MNVTVSDAIKYVGCDDVDLDLFESQYSVPNGISYNSYLIIDDKTCLMDTVDKRKGDEWLKNVEKELDGRNLDYLVVLHMEPDHAGCIKRLLEKYPNVTVVGNAKTFLFCTQFFGGELENKFVVAEGSTLELGKHALTFVTAPMVHWPEAMVAYESSEKILFSADAFGTFGALCNHNENWLDEARRYYINIVGKYGSPVQTLLKKAAALDIKTICPLHGPILKENLGYYIDKYDVWSSYRPEEKGVLVAYASIHGNTAEAAYEMAKILKEKGEDNVTVVDLSREDMSQAVALAFKYDKMVMCAATYDGGIFTPAEQFLARLKHKTYQNRKVGLVENGTWAAMANKLMNEAFTSMKDVTVCESKVSIKSAMKAADIEAMKCLADELLG